MARLARISVCLSKREVEIFKQVKEALGEDDTGAFTYMLKAYTDAHNLIYEALHPKCATSLFFTG